MATHIIPSSSNLAALLETPAKPSPGRASEPFRASELTLVLNKNPGTFQEREKRVNAMKRNGYLVPVNEALEFLTLDPDFGNDDQSAFDTFQQLSWS
jgi:hypothetical protein